jgi:hypothetical protein
MAGIVDNLQKMKGYLNKDSNQGSLWVGATLKPLKKFENNFMVLSTDYNTFAIVTTCTPKSVMYDQDEITILVRQNPQFLEQEFEEKIKTEYKRIFEQIEDEAGQEVFKDGRNQHGSKEDENN